MKPHFCSGACLHAVGALIVLLASGGEAQAATRYVSPDGGNRYPYTTPEDAAHSIQPAVDAAAHGDEVLVGRGSYGEHVTLKQGVSLSGTDADQAIIYGVSPAKPVLTLTWDNVLKALTIVGSPYAGAGIYAELAVPPPNTGKFAPFRISDCTIWSCVGPGVLIMAGYDYDVDFTVPAEPIPLSPNRLTPGGQPINASATHEAQLHVEVSGCRIENCGGSALVLDLAKVPDGYDIKPPKNPGDTELIHPTLNMSDCTIAQCGQHGVVVRAGWGGRAHAIIDSCVVLENGGCGVYVTSAGGTPGGAVLQIDNSLVASNGRAGVYCLSIDYTLRKLWYWLYWPPEAPKAWATGLVSALSSTIARNSIGIAGSSPFPGLVPMHGPRLLMSNCIVFGNQGSDFDFPSWAENGRLFGGGVTHSCTGNKELGGTDGNLDIDPLFADPEDGHFHLLLGSPCIDAGGMYVQPTVSLEDGSALISWDPGNDLDGNPRIAGNAPDMGAYELLGDAPNYLIESSTDLLTWAEEYFGFDTSWTDPGAGSIPTKFYRVRIAQ